MELENRTTGNDLIRVLECCLNGDRTKSAVEICLPCPYFHEGNCTDLLKRNALDLIKRQRAEIEELNAEVEKQYEQAKADILGNMADGGMSCHWCIKQHKAEAIKEFAKNLKQDLSQHQTEMFLNGLKGTPRTQEITYQCVGEYIDDLVEEMTADEHEPH